jgi:hypothetical protein
MTTADLPVAGLRKRSSEIRPGRTLGTAIAWVLVVIGWITGAFWRGLVFLALVLWHKVLVFGVLSLRYGYWRGLGLTDEQIEATVKARAAARAGGEAT